MNKDSYQELLYILELEPVQHDLNSILEDPPFQVQGNYHCNLQDQVDQPLYAQQPQFDQNLQQQLLSSYDFDKLVEETLEEKVRICEQQREVEFAMATEKFFRESYDNLLNMGCGPSHLPKIPEEERKETEKFLADSWYNLLHMFDDENSPETGNLGQFLADTDMYTTSSSSNNAGTDPQ